MIIYSYRPSVFQTWQAGAPRPSPIRRRVFSRAVLQDGKGFSDAADCAICMVKFKQGDEVGLNREWLGLGLPLTKQNPPPGCDLELPPRLPLGMPTAMA